MLIGKIDFPSYSGVRCLMMPYIQGDPDSVPSAYQSYCEIIASVFIRRGDVGYFTIDESATHFATSLDGDIGDKASDYPYEDAVMMRAGEVHKIGILTPHESLPVRSNFKRQFLRIVSSGVHGREDYFTVNPLMGI